MSEDAPPYGPREIASRTVIVAGPRDAPESAELIARAVEASPFTVAVLVEGGARGIDRAARLWAEERGIPVETFAADWKRHGRAAGPIRNREMARRAGAAIVLSRGEADEGPGTSSMIEEARKAGIPIFIWPLPTEHR